MHVKSKSTHQQQSHQIQANSWNLKQIALVGVLIATALTGSVLAQSESGAPFEVETQKNKNFPAAEAARIYNAVCVVVAREIRPEHPPLLQPRFKLVLGADKDELIQNNDVTEIRLESWDREKYAQAVVILAGREILKTKHISQLSRRALAWTDAVVPMSDLAEAK